jgi:acyl-CoA thioesterase-1
MTRSFNLSSSKLPPSGKHFERRTRIMIAGMRLPPNLGADYTGEFEQVFSELATKNGAVLVPFLLEGVGGNRGLNQPDQIHPTAAGQKIIAETVWKRLQPLLQTK